MQFHNMKSRLKLNDSLASSKYLALGELSLSSYVRMWLIPGNRRAIALGGYGWLVIPG